MTRSDLKQGATAFLLYAVALLSCRILIGEYGLMRGPSTLVPEDVNVLRIPVSAMAALPLALGFLCGGPMRYAMAPTLVGLSAVSGAAGLYGVVFVFGFMSLFGAPAGKSLEPGYLIPFVVTLVSGVVGWGIGREFRGGGESSDE